MATELKREPFGIESSLGSSDNIAHPTHKRIVSLDRQEFMHKHQNLIKNSPHRLVSADSDKNGSNYRKQHQFHQQQLAPVDRSIFDTIDVEDDISSFQASQSFTPSMMSNNKILLSSHEWMNFPDDLPDNTFSVNQQMFEEDVDNYQCRIEAPSQFSYNRFVPMGPGQDVYAHAVPVPVTVSLPPQPQFTAPKRPSKPSRQIFDDPKTLIAEADITDNDVICERGGKSNRHAGTKKYRGMIEKFKPQYRDIKAKNDKTNLSRKIIKLIQEQKGGRFLKKDEESGLYYVLSTVETTKKVSQALREKKALKWVEACS